MSIISDVREYNQLRKQRNIIDQRMKELGNTIKSYSLEHGVKDQNGSSYLQDNDFVYGNQAKKSIKLSQEKAKKYFSELGLLDKVIEAKYEVSEDKINDLLQEGTLTEEDVEKIMDVKVSYSLMVKETEGEKEEKEEEMPVIETQTKKKKLIKKKVK